MDPAPGAKPMPTLVDVVPNEQWQLLLEFADGEHRIFDASVARVEKGWAELAYPDKLKHLSFDARGVSWPGGRTLDAAYLHAKSRPIGPDALANQVLRLGYRNQAPTSVHPSHHVYGVYLYPFRGQPFEVGESIGGGHGDMGGSASYGLLELLAWPEWKHHFELSGCAWAAPLVQAMPAERELLRTLVRQVCLREGERGA